jgi:AraC-like DNA-binding protein
LLYQKLLFGTEPYFVTEGKVVAFELHRHAEIELSFCLEGSYRISANGKVFEIKKNELAVIGSLTPHEYLGTDNKNSKCLILEVGPALLRNYFEPLAQGYKNLRILSLNDSGSPFYGELKKLLCDIHTAYKEHPPMSEFIIRGDLYKICALLLRDSANNEALGRSTTALRDVVKVEKALEIIYNRYNEPLDIDTVSAACGYSKSNFCKTFKSVTGETFHDLLNRHRIEIACVLLCETGNSVEQIATEVGFSDVKSFCRVFKSLMGETAGNYRKHK